MSLSDKQKVFSILVAKLILRAAELGYEVTLGEAWRIGGDPAHSCHPHRLAIDINLFYDGKYLCKTEDHKSLGEWWENQSTDLYECCWGGRFTNPPDGNHYSIEYQGIR